MSILSNLASRLREEAKYDKTKVIFTHLGPMCRKCWSAGRALTPTCCFCTGDVKSEKRVFVDPPLMKKQNAKTKKK